VGHGQANKRRGTAIRLTRDRLVAVVRPGRSPASGGRGAEAERRQRRSGRGNSNGGEERGAAQQCAAPGASMWPREDARQVTRHGGSAEGRARRWRSDGGRGSSGSSDCGARLDQQAAQGAFVMHKGELRSLCGLRRRREGDSHRRRQWRTARLSGGYAARAERPGAGFYR
jgi:hypothetical protein